MAVTKISMGMVGKSESCHQIRGKGLGWHGSQRGEAITNLGIQGWDSEGLGQGQHTEEKRPTRSKLGADPGHKLSLLKPQFPKIAQEEPCGLLGSELDALGRGGLGSSTALSSSHISVFPSLPPQDLCEVGPCILPLLPSVLKLIPLQHSLPVQCPWALSGLSVASKHVGMTEVRM